MLYRTLEINTVLRDAGGLHHHHLVDAVGNGLGEERYVIAHHLLIVVVDEPTGYIGMAFQHHNKGVQSARLQA